MKKKDIAVFAAVAVVCVCVLLGWLIYDSSVDRSGWETTEQGTMYKDFHGDYVTGWEEIGGYRFHFGEDHTLTTGWLESEEGQFYFTESGHLCTGWRMIENETYCFGEDGRMLTGWVDGRYLSEDGTVGSGWLEEGGVRYYLSGNGYPVTGRTILDGKIYYFQENGVMRTGWATFSGLKSYFTDSGEAALGWQEIDGQRYYFDEDAFMKTGWLEEGEYRYYLTEDGSAATTPTEIDGQMCFFTPKGIQVVLVNPWNYLPEDYEVDLVTTLGNYWVDSACKDSLEAMLADCKAAGHGPILASAYRTHSYQSGLYWRKVEYWRGEGYNETMARQLAGTSVAVPGTSEHQLGLAVDIIDSRYTKMDRKQASTETQKWLMEHCWEYGFILRYLDGTSEITGIIFEPWHYRYVGKEVALELRDLGITLEEYLGAADHA